MNTNTLDEWDFQLILSFKRYRLDIFDQLRLLWSKRNGVDSKYIRLIDIAHELEKIRLSIWEVNKNTQNSVFELLMNNYPYKQIHWCDFNPIIEKMKLDEQYWARLILAYGPAMRFCKSADIPGLDDYFNNVWLKAGKP